MVRGARVIPSCSDIYLLFLSLTPTGPLCSERKAAERNSHTTLRTDTYTEVVPEDIKLDVKTPPRVFTKSYLERK